MVAATLEFLVIIRVRTLTLAAFFLVFWLPYILANDSVFERWPEGDDGNRAVEFCGECHLQLAERDHLFELPEKFIRR